MDDKKADKDFGTVDYDHLCPLKSCYIRGGNKWTKAQKNAYAYDQWVAVDVLYSANRSKGDKGPLEYLPDINLIKKAISLINQNEKYLKSYTIDIMVGEFGTALIEIHKNSK